MSPAPHSPAGLSVVDFAALLTAEVASVFPELFAGLPGSAAGPPSAQSQ